MSNSSKYDMEAYLSDTFENESMISGNESEPEKLKNLFLFKSGSNNKLIDAPNDLHPHVNLVQ
eukprot:14736299-Ditylum_brightwellii.AAC.1